MLLSCNFFLCNVKNQLLILLFFPSFLFGQLPFQKKYKSKFNQGISLETFPGKNVSLQYTKNFYITDYSFFSASGGVAYIFGNAPAPGAPNPWLFYDSGIGIPVTVSYNMSLGSIDNVISNIFSRGCYKNPPKFNVDCFLEGGVGANPSFYKKTYRNAYYPSVYGGGRLHFFIRRPYKEKDILLFMRGGIKPHLYRNIPNYDYVFSIGTAI